MCAHFPAIDNTCNFSFSLIICAFMTVLGMTFLILACALPTPKIFYPFFVLIFYVLSVLSVFISKRTTPNNETNPKSEFALFLTAGMVLSAFALPVVLAHSAVVSSTKIESNIYTTALFNTLDKLDCVLADADRQRYKLFNYVWLCHAG